MKFSIKANDPTISARTGILKTDHGIIETPVFMPVGTVGAVKTMTPNELTDAGSKIILGNTYHLYLRPGTDIVNQGGGLHSFINWDGAMLTDSGGFQVFSLAQLNKINDYGVEFRSHLNGSKHLFTPEKSMEIQRLLGADIIMAFDQCPPGNAELPLVKQAVQRTSDWMARCETYLATHPPIYDWVQTVFPIVQGAINPDLRKQSAEELIPYSKCGMAIGGLAVGEEKNAMMETIDLCDSLLPKDQPRYLMGVGRPSDLVKAVRMGVDMFDCVMPTRNGRNGQLFTSTGVINIRNEKYKDDFSPVDENSTISFGVDFTKAYLRHLIKVNEILGLRMASYINIAYYQNLMQKMRNEINAGTFDSWSKKWLNEMADRKRM
ncbi:MAG: tRNA guanosine(34) transglycosylase Tgt [Candidatus Marinimicrobia bacterium]|jgi:queuine tRNA-ribosyltransferase|nr:tRNA guanosine(34) transglycosylase Tgt [Candidatus Neomarinimicrobiota bacterium]MBT3937745.1 tRNA guanosine(34) transglycosylase Tgt [Candidatus Neomarinimicrobiota bacterium]MBT3962301.1 tRNA guanosine(34) transglycosylase Tgt [Candidatus Neomarinimicrobiota bacterium]MBT4382554.1 tRNA guanosine(34) transglycosylase Tgt [Candidatus Neomarinimicrobiota bacterium]MBT4635161.1 tRNA guanosine(34) transglycosylase Tgt [Candidatus Neomarinimicrobiota bacterium]